MEDRNSISRREFLIKASMTVGGIVAASFLPKFGSFANAQPTPPVSPSGLPIRHLGSLKVSAIGLGCMNIAGTYNPSNVLLRFYKSGPKVTKSFRELSQLFMPMQPTYKYDEGM